MWYVVILIHIAYKSLDVTNLLSHYYFKELFETNRIVMIYCYPFIFYSNIMTFRHQYCTSDHNIDFVMFCVFFEGLVDRALCWPVILWFEQNSFIWSAWGQGGLHCKFCLVNQSVWCKVNPFFLCKVVQLFSQDRILFLVTPHCPRATTAQLDPEKSQSSKKGW